MILRAWLYLHVEMLACGRVTSACLTLHMLSSQLRIYERTITVRSYDATSIPHLGSHRYSASQAVKDNVPGQAFPQKVRCFVRGDDRLIPCAAIT